MSKVLAFRRERFAADSEARRQLGGTTGFEADGVAPSGTTLHEDHAPRQQAVELQISVVVPTRGRPDLLNRCLASLVLQHFDPARFEIIVVDDGPGNETHDVVARWARHSAGTGPCIAYIPSPGPHGPAAARNFGWRAARGEIVAFTDDDTIARADWLKNGLQAFDDSDADAVWGRIVMPLHGTPTDYELDAKGLETAEFVTANCFCRKSVLEALDGFDERFRFAWREDADLYFRLLTSHANIVHAPHAVMTHPIRPAGWGVSLSQAKKVQFDALLYKKHPQLYRIKIRPKPRWDFYVTVGSLLTAVAGLLAGAPEVGVPSGLLWLFLTGRFCRRRLMQTSKSPTHVLEMIVTSALIPPIAVYWRAVGALRFRVGFL